MWNMELYQTKLDVLPTGDKHLTQQTRIGLLIFSDQNGICMIITSYVSMQVVRNMNI